MMMVDPKVKTLPIDLKLEVQSPLSLTEVMVNSKTKKKTTKLKNPNTPAGNGEESETEDEGETRYWNLKQAGDEVTVHKVGTYQSYHT